MIKLSPRSVVLTAALALAYASTPVAAASLDHAAPGISATIGTATLARNGADNAPGDDRGGRGRGADDGRGHARNGADNAPGDDRGGRGRGADDGRGHA